MAGLGKLLGAAGGIAGGIIGSTGGPMGAVQGAGTGMSTGQMVGGLIAPEQQNNAQGLQTPQMGAMARRLEATSQSQLAALGQGLQAARSPDVPDYVRQAAEAPLMRAMEFARRG